MFENPDFRAAMREMINGEIGRLRNEMSCSSVAAAADGKTAPVLTDPSSEAGSQILSGGAVAVCPSIVPGLAQEPVPFGSEQEALQWLLARDVKTSPVQMGIDRERGTDDPPSDKGNISEDGTSEAATSTLTNLITIGAHNQRWRAPIPVKKIGGYDLTVRFDGSIASLLPLAITQLPEEPSLGAKI
jgi:hypothetical protein